MVKNLKCISRLNIHYYPNRRYKSYITSLKAVIAGKSLISAELDIDRILHFVFLIKYSKFTDNIGSGNFTDTLCQNTDRFQKSGGWAEGGVVGDNPLLGTPLDAPNAPTLIIQWITVKWNWRIHWEWRGECKVIEFISFNSNSKL